MYINYGTYNTPQVYVYMHVYDNCVFFKQLLKACMLHASHRIICVGLEHASLELVCMYTIPV